MASVVNLSYKRLQNEKELEANILKREVKKAKAWLKFKALAGRRRSPRLRITSLRRFLRKRTKILSRVTVSWCNKSLKKLKNGQSHMNDLFGGNFLFMQGNSKPFGYGEKGYNVGYNLHKLQTKYSVSRIS